MTTDYVRECKKCGGSGKYEGRGIYGVCYSCGGEGKINFTERMRQRRKNEEANKLWDRRFAAGQCVACGKPAMVRSDGSKDTHCQECFDGFELF